MAGPIGAGYDLNVRGSNPRALIEVVLDAGVRMARRRGLKPIAARAHPGRNHQIALAVGEEARHQGSAQKAGGASDEHLYRRRPATTCSKIRSIQSEIRSISLVEIGSGPSVVMQS